jgi:hypothetical protein
MADNETDLILEPLSKVNIDPLTNEVFFLSDDGRVSFRIMRIDDHSIEITGGMMIKSNRIIYTESLQIEPRASNSFIIKKKPYDN